MSSILVKRLEEGTDSQTGMRAHGVNGTNTESKPIIPTDVTQAPPKRNFLTPSALIVRPSPLARKPTNGRSIATVPVDILLRESLLFSKSSSFPLRNFSACTLHQKHNFLWSASWNSRTPSKGRAKPIFSASSCDLKQKNFFIQHHWLQGRLAFWLCTHIKSKVVKATSGMYRSADAQIRNVEKIIVPDFWWYLQWHLCWWDLHQECGIEKDPSHHRYWLSSLHPRSQRGCTAQKESAHSQREPPWAVKNILQSMFHTKLDLAHDWHWPSSSHSLSPRVHCPKRIHPPTEATAWCCENTSLSPCLTQSMILLNIKIDQAAHTNSIITLGRICKFRDTAALNCAKRWFCPCATSQECYDESIEHIIGKHYSHRTTKFIA